MHQAARSFKFTLLMMLASGLIACSGVKPGSVGPHLDATPGAGALTAERPKDEAFRTELKKEISTINLALEASTDELAATLNQVIGKDIYKGSTRTKGLTADVVRKGPVAVAAADNYLYLTVPIAMSLSYGMFETPAIPLKLRFKLAARVTPDWKVEAEIYYVGLTELMAEQIGIGPLSIKPRSIVEGITQPVQKVLSDAISRRLNDQFPLKAQVAKAWDAAQKPILIDRKYNAWLKMTPQEVMLFPLSAQNNRVKLSVGLTSYAEVRIGPEPALSPPVPLPRLKVVNTLDRNFRIALNTDLPYRDILAIATPLLLNRDFGSDGKSVVLKGLDIYGNGQSLVVKLETTGSLEGTFYLTCRPGFEPRTNVFSVEDVDFEMQTRSLLLQSADWFLHGSIRSAIREKLNMDLTKRLEESREMAGKAMAQVRLADYLVMKGTMKSLQFSDMVVKKESISVQLYSEGETSVLLQ